MLNLKENFLKYESNNWYTRTISFRKEPTYYDDLYSKKIIKFINNKKDNIKVLEIGCSDGLRIKFIKSKLKKNNATFYGIDPSNKAIKNKFDSKIIIKKGTADDLLYKESTFDLILYSFCLYVCDNLLLPNIVSECFRVAKKNANIMIFDFYSTKTTFIKYKHIKNQKIRKMNYSKLFKYLPNITLIKETILDYNLFYKDKKKLSKIKDKLAIHILKIKKF